MPTILFNNQTGSDTSSSGAGPTIAISGTGAAHTNGAASTTITLTNTPDLTNIATDATHAIWLATPSGRQLSFITAKDNAAKTVTVEDSFTIASGSAVNYAIGGKRQTLMGSSQIFTDVKTNWVYTLEYTGVNYVITSAISMTTNANRTIQGDSENNLTTVELQYNGNGFLGGGNGGYVNNYKNLKAISTSATKTTGAMFATTYHQQNFYNCVIGDPVNKLYNGVSGSGVATHFYYSAIVNCLSTGFAGGVTTNTPGVTIINSLIANNGGDGIKYSSDKTYIQNSIFYNNNGYGAFQFGASGSSVHTVVNSIFANNANSAFRYGWGSANTGRFEMINNIFLSNGTAVETLSATPIAMNLFLGNVFWNNTAKYPNVVAPIVKDELDINPQFANPATYNFTVTNPLVLGKSYPQQNPAIKNASLVNLGTAGAVQSGGGGLLLPRPMNGGYSA